MHSFSSSTRLVALTTSSPLLLLVVVLLFVLIIPSTTNHGGAVLAQANTTVVATTTAPAPTPPSPPVTTAASTGTPAPPTPAPPTLPTSRIDLIFSFFAEDRDSVNSYTVTIAQLLGVPQRRIDFYNVRQGDTTPEDERRPSNTPFGAKTMARVTVQYPLPTDADQTAAVEIRDKLLQLVKDGNVALEAIFIDDANPIDSNFIFSYSVKTVFDLMYTFVIATMGLSYVIFIGFVIWKLIESQQHKKLERISRQKEKELRKVKAAASAHGGKDIDDDDEEVVDTSRFDNVGDEGGDEEDGPGDIIRDEDGMAVRTLASDVANVLKGDRDGTGPAFSPTSRRPVTFSSSKLLAELDNMALPPSRYGGGNNDEL